MISRVLLENWRSHKRSELKFGKGTNVLVGVMGSGKTSIMDAICFALFGTFPALKSRQLSLDEIILSKPNKAENARVELEFEHNENKYLIERTFFANSKQSQAKLLINGKFKAGLKQSEVNEEVEKILEIDFELFSRAIYAEQNQIDFFLKLSPQERKKKFDELLELEKYETVRANAVQVLNVLKKTSEDRKRLLHDLEGKFKISEINEVWEKTALKQKRILEVEELEKRLRAGLSSIEASFKELWEKKKRFESLQQEFLKNSGKLEELQESLKVLESGLEGIALNFDEISARKKTLDERLSALKKAQEQVLELRKDIEVLNSKKLFFESEVNAAKAVEPRNIENLKQEDEKLRVLEIRFLEQQIVLEEQGSAEKTSKGRIESEIFEQKAFVEELQKLGVDALCPTCKRTLSAEHRLELVSAAGLKISTLEKSLSTNSSNLLNLEAKRKQLVQEIETANSSKNALQKSFEILEKISQNLEKIAETEKQALEKQNTLSAKSSEFSENEAELIEKECRMLEKALDAVSKKKSIQELEARINECNKSLAMLSFNSGDFEKAGSEIAEKKALLSGIEREKSSVREVLDELNARLKDLQKMQEQLESLKCGIECSRISAEKLGIFINALQSTQAELRAFLIQNINSAMNDIWPRVYPYKDFSSARIEVNEGNYEVSVLSRSGSWTRVEGILSGGERTAAAITIRVAFSLVLAGQLSWLILDEPTHNLDSNAVQVLSGMLKDHLPQLVEQVFVITHDKELEKAASSKVFELLREKDDDGVSQVVEKVL